MLIQIKNFKPEFLVFNTEYEYIKTDIVTTKMIMLYFTFFLYLMSIRIQHQFQLLELIIDNKPAISPPWWAARNISEMF